VSLHVFFAFFSSSGSRKKMGGEAFLMVEFDIKTSQPCSVSVYSESEQEITLIGNDYVRVASMTWDHSLKDAWDFDLLHTILMTQLKKGLYDACKVTFQGKTWTVAECQAAIQRQMAQRNQQPGDMQVEV
jgi:hypothetical protein